MTLSLSFIKTYLLNFECTLYTKVPLETLTPAIKADRCVRAKVHSVVGLISLTVVVRRREDEWGLEKISHL
jgi:hypothetical protein